MEIKLSTDRPSIDEILVAWKREHGVKCSANGTEFVIIKANLRNLEILADTLSDAGYTYEEMQNNGLAVKIGKFCWRKDKIVRLSKTKVEENIVSVALDWKEAVGKYSGITTSKKEPTVYKEEVRAVSPPPKLPEINPSLP